MVYRYRWPSFHNLGCYLPALLLKSGLGMYQLSPTAHRTALYILATQPQTRW